MLQATDKYEQEIKDTGGGYKTIIMSLVLEGMFDKRRQTAVLIAKPGVMFAENELQIRNKSGNVLVCSGYLTRSELKEFMRKYGIGKDDLQQAAYDAAGKLIIQKKGAKSNAKASRSTKPAAKRSPKRKA